MSAVVGIDAAIEGHARRAYVERRLASALREPALHAQFAACSSDGLVGFHVAALALIASSIAADSRWPVLAASLVGAVGALAFAIFYGVLLQRMRKPRS